LAKLAYVVYEVHKKVKKEQSRVKNKQMHNTTANNNKPLAHA